MESREVREASQRKWRWSEDQKEVRTGFAGGGKTPAEAVRGDAQHVLMKK